MAKKKEEEKKGTWWRKYTMRHVEEPKEAPKKEQEPTQPESPKTRREYIDPFTETGALQKQLDKTFRDLFSRDLFRFPEIPAVLKMKSGVFRKPYARVKQTDKEVLVTVEMPGAKKENIKIKIDGLNLIIDAQVRKQEEKREGGMFRTSASYQGFRNIIRMPCPVVKEKSRAQYSSGVLKIILPKKETKEGPSDVEVE